MNESRDFEAVLGTGQRGPVDHERREQIIQAADEHFRRYGYGKTTVGDLAKAIGVSSAYVYRFFESKRAIGEAVCGMTLGRIDAELLRLAGDEKSASDRLRRIYRTLFEQGLELFFKERKLHDIVVAAMDEHWSSIDAHRAALLEVITRVVTAGRESGEFERKTPLDEVCRAICETLAPFAHPVLLEQKPREQIDESVAAVSNLVLRSLAP
jgi:AcrR family transcriptional regulator